MSGSTHSSTSHSPGTGIHTVYTDGACSGNPGPGGWAWVGVDGGWATGFEADTTNQRMEVTAALRACERFDGPLRIVSDSTYVVNCWRDHWWQGWLKRGWKNSRKDPVANRDLWEQLVPHFRDREDLELEWVKGHSGDRFNDIADRLAVAAVQRRSGARGEGQPTEDDLADEDRPVRSRAADPRVPGGHLLVVAGLRSGALTIDHPVAEVLGQVIEAQAELESDLVVLSGLRAGAEDLGAEVALEVGVPLIVILPYPDPTAGWPESERIRFDRFVAAARDVVTLERRRPSELDGRRKALARRDGWMRNAAELAIVITDGHDIEAEASLRRWEKALGDDVWRLDVAEWLDGL